MSEHRAGWYDDPDDPTHLRYWDGVVWSEHRVPKEAPRRPEPQGEPVAGMPAPGAAAGGPASPVDAARRPMPPYQDPRAQYPYSQYTPSGGGYPSHVPFNQRLLAEPVTPDGAQLATWGRRFGAWVLDGILIVAVTMLLSRWLVPGYWDAVSAFSDARDYSPEALSSLMDRIGTDALKLSVLSWGVATVYAVPCWMIWGATAGKAATGLRVRMYDRPGRLPLGPALVRRLVPLVALAVPFGQFLDGLWPLWDGRRQTLHDKAAQTAVVVAPKGGPRGGSGTSSASDGLP